MPNSEPSHFEHLLVGVLIGGASLRMGGQPKGLLPVPGSRERIVPRLLRLSKETLPGAGRLLVGRHAAYADIEVPQLDDATPAVGPLGGLVALLRAARAGGQSEVLLLASDLPHLSAELLLRLAVFETSALAVAPWIDGRYQPLFARYRVTGLALAEEALDAPDRSLQALLRALGASAFPLDAADLAALVDWDEPADVTEG
jgi:molybdopterin-guanine dinucleotide biosynthesis protein A